MARGPRYLTCVLLLASCVDEPPPPGTSIGAFSFVGDFHDTEPPGGPFPDPLADIGCADPGATLPTCIEVEPEDPLRFDALLSYEPDPSGTNVFHFQPVNDTTRDGTLDGTSFSTVAPEPVGCSNVGVPREIPECSSCGISAVEWIRGDLLERLPEGGCTIDTATPQQSTFDPASFGAICGTLVVRLTLRNIDPDLPCECVEQDPPEAGEDLTQRPPVDCAIVYTLTGTRS